MILKKDILIGSNDTTQDGQVTGANQGTSHDTSGQKTDTQQLDVLLKNYNKEEYIAPPERIGIFVRGYGNTLAGKAGIGKSWQVIRWARDLSRGGECFGGVTTNEPKRNVLVFAGELPKKEMERRCRLLEEGDGKERDYNNFHIVDLKQAEAVNKDLMLDSKNGQNNIEEIIKYVKPDIVFFDSFVSVSDGDESLVKDVKPVMVFLDRMAEKYSTAIVLIHHMRKKLSRERLIPSDIDDVIGSNVFSRRSGFMFIAEETEIEGQKVIIVKEAKSWLEKTKPFTFHVKRSFYGQGVIMDINTNVDDKRSISSQGVRISAPQPPEWKYILTAFLKGKGKDGATIKEIHEALGRAKEDQNTTAQQLKRMYDKGELIKPKGKKGIYALPDSQIPVATDIELAENAQLEFESETK